MRNERPCLEARYGLFKQRSNNVGVWERFMVSKTRRQQTLSGTLSHKDE